MKRSSQYLLLPCAVLLTACSAQPNMSDLREWTAQVAARPGGNIEPLPEFVPYEPFAYSAVGMRNPFEPPIAVKPQRPQSGKIVKPDLTRQRQYLEQYNVIDLKMVGTLSRELDFFGLIQEPSGGVHRVRVGDYMGQNHGKITGVSETEVQLTEIVSDGTGGWLERNRTMRLGGGAIEERG